MEEEKVRKKVEEAEEICMAENPGLERGCLDVCALLIAYSHYKQDYGH